MKNVWYIAVIAVLLLAGCQQKEDLMTKQQTSIVRYLESGHIPRLISEDAANDSLDENPPYYTVLGRKAYRYIATQYDEGRDELIPIEPGDMVDIRFDAYVFNYTSLTNVAPYWSNRDETIARLIATGGHLDPEYWSKEPLRLKAGSNDTLYGVSQSLVGCCEGDEVEVYMTYDAAYGSAIVGMVPKESPVAWLFTIEKVTRK